MYFSERYASVYHKNVRWLVKTVALSQNDLICVSTANRQKLVIFIVTYEMATLLVLAFYLVKSCEKAIFLMRPFGSVVLPKKV